jgi:hypothetical protein
LPKCPARSFHNRAAEHIPEALGSLKREEGAKRAKLRKEVKTTATERRGDPKVADGHGCCGLKALRI